MKKKLLVSACLTGCPCRYDGASKPNGAVMALEETWELIPVCPEELGGLSTPRLPSERVGEQVLHQNGVSVTDEFRLGAERCLQIAKEEGVSLALLKARSPSCGKGHIYDGTFTHTLCERDGMTAELLLKNGISVLSEEELEKLPY